MSENQNNPGSERDRESDADVVFDESYDAEEVESVVLSDPDGKEEFEDEDEDELDRIPLEQEPDSEDIRRDLETERERRQQHSNAVTGEKGQQNESKAKQEYGLGLTAMILGIISILGFCVPVIGLVLATVSLILGIVATAKNNGKKMGTSGIIMGSIVLLSYLVIFIFFGGVFGMVSKNQDRLTDTAWRRTTDGSVLYLYSDGTFIDVEQEGVFTDNFYSGTYDILSYEDTGLDFAVLEGQYYTDYAYDVYLYVNTYVKDGTEREEIAGTIRYLYLFERNYDTGDAVDVCAHDTTQYGTVYPVKETIMAFPTIGNQYISSMEEAEPDASVTEEEPLQTEEQAGESTEAENTTTENVPAESATAENTATNSFWDDFGDLMDESREEFDNLSSSVSEEFDNFSSVSEEWAKNSESISSVAEDISSAVEEASNAAAEASSEAEEIKENLDASGIWEFFQNIFQWFQDLFS